MVIAWEQTWRIFTASLNTTVDLRLLGYHEKQTKSDIVSKTIGLSLFFRYVVKFFEHRIYNTMFYHLLENNLFSENQFAFNYGDSCIN